MDAAKETFKAVVAIDIGTTYSGYAFSFKHEYDIDPLKISLPQIFIAGESNYLSNKTASSLLLNEAKEFLAFGFDAESTYANAPNKDALYLFHRFKMSLYNTKDISKNLNIKDITGKKTVSAMHVFAMSIKALKDDFIQLMKTKNIEEYSCLEKRILWVITVPAIWPPNAKLFMIECAKKAGLAEHQISIALEPEAGAICCQQKNDLRITDIGQAYLVADLGGGTADFAVHERVAAGGLKELHKADGVDSGGTNVDKEFFEFFSELFDTPNIQSRLCKESQFDLYRSIEITKRRVKYDKTEDIVIDVPDLITEDGRNIQENARESILKYCKTHGTDIVKVSRGRKLIIKISLFKGFFKVTIDRITQKIRKVLDETAPKAVDTILLVGGFAESTMVVEGIRATFSDKTVISPTDAGLAILQGAVLYGYDNEIIISRILTHSYGQQTCRKFDASKDRGRETIERDGEVYLVGAFQVIAAAGEEIKRGDERTFAVGTLSDFQPAIGIKFYACPDRTPEYVDDHDCTEIGSLFLPFFIPLPAGRPILVNTKFGGTVIRATAIDPLLSTACSTTFKLKD